MDVLNGISTSCFVLKAVAIHRGFRESRSLFLLNDLALRNSESGSSIIVYPSHRKITSQKVILLRSKLFFSFKVAYLSLS